ncbi:hypothetical protein PIB30_110674, partial [Stylosanthes scabra]|nr:hypothetical protein [Stylosanthes scabra]
LAVSTRSLTHVDRREAQRSLSNAAPAARSRSRSKAAPAAPSRCCSAISALQRRLFSPSTSISSHLQEPTLAAAYHRRPPQHDAAPRRERLRLAARWSTSPTAARPQLPLPGKARSSFLRRSPQHASSGAARSCLFPNGRSLAGRPNSGVTWSPNLVSCS